ncbi:MAG: hypothetical protein E6J91_37495 [Deltaproteobacteria bacterium]|nr:MAG: hypothetical protein E6J91_37495 [Deltaproteobacteria bacterium]
MTEADGVMSAIRIFNQLALAPRATFEATLLVMLANVEPAAGEHHEIVMRMMSDAGEVLGTQRFAVRAPLAAGESFSLVLPFRLQAPAAETTFWLCLAYDTEDQELTRLPLQFRRPATTA